MNFSALILLPPASASMFPRRTMIRFLPRIVALVTAILLVAAFVAPLNAVLPPQYQKGTIAVYSSPSGATIGLESEDGAFVGPYVTTSVSTT